MLDYFGSWLLTRQVGIASDYYSQGLTFGVSVNCGDFEPVIG